MLTQNVEWLQRSLDERPWDIALRFALADELMDCSDPRGIGFKALATLGVYPHECGLSDNKDVHIWFYSDGHVMSPEEANQTRHVLPVAWLGMMPLATTNAHWGPRYGSTQKDGVTERVHGPASARRTAEDEAAKAFIRLDEEFQQLILSGGWNSD